MNYRVYIKIGSNYEVVFGEITVKNVKYEYDVEKLKKIRNKPVLLFF